MLRGKPSIRFRLAAIVAAHWWDFVRTHGKWIRPVVFENVRKVLACRTPVLGCHLYRCDQCGQVKVVPHSCKSRFCPTCGKHATDVWSEQVLNRLLDVPYHHLVVAIPWQLRTLVLMNRGSGLNLLVSAAVEAIQQWARDVKKMRMGIMAVIHTFGSDVKWHPHVHLIVTGGGLSLDGQRWIATDPRFLMPHMGLKKRWKYQVITRMKKAHKERVWRFRTCEAFLKSYPRFAATLNRLWSLIWYAHIGASLLDPRFSVRYIGRYTKRAVLAEYRITYYDGKLIRFAFRDYAEGGVRSYKTMKVHSFIARLIRHIPDRSFPMIRSAGLFSNRWKQRYLAQARAALDQTESQTQALPHSTSWADRQTEYTGSSPLLCPDCKIPLTCVGTVFGNWADLELLFKQAGDARQVSPALRRSG